MRACVLKAIEVSMCGPVGRQGLLLGGGEHRLDRAEAGLLGLGQPQEEVHAVRRAHLLLAPLPERVPRGPARHLAGECADHQGVVAVLVSGGVGAGQKEGDVVVHRSARGQGVDDRCA